MKDGLEFLPLPIKICYCACCGLGNAASHYAHDLNCRHHVYCSDPRLVPYWQHGRDGHSLLPNALPEQRKAFEMGKAIRAKMEPTPPTPAQILTETHADL